MDRAARIVPSAIVNNFLKFVLYFCGDLWFNTLMIKNGIEQNVVATTTEMNLAAAKCAETFPKACLLFRRLEHANNRGTGEHAYDLLEQHFNEKENLY